MSVWAKTITIELKLNIELSRSPEAIFELTCLSITLAATVTGLQIAEAGEFLKIEAIGATNWIVDRWTNLWTIRLVVGHRCGSYAG